ncbi:MAG: hypothetical protein KF729_11835 [Sandaracinaceae bacterium]|nr:hypothetical protein [Sandaracinaceae bacterium]
MSYLRATIALALVACGGGAAPPPTDEAFRRIQVYEATIAHQRAGAEACAEGERCPAERELCDAVEGLCALARSIEDPDALARCAIARRSCPEPR